VIDVLAQGLEFLQRTALIERELFGQLREIRGQVLAAFVGRDELPKSAAFSCSSAATLPSPAALGFLTLSVTSVAEMLTLFSTLPMLCSTLVAISAMPAWREASRNCCCSTRSRSSASTRSVMSRSMPTSRGVASIESVDNRRERGNVSDRCRRGARSDIESVAGRGRAWRS
jgi:hypothetical protein